MKICLEKRVLDATIEVFWMEGDCFFPKEGIPVALVETRFLEMNYTEERIAKNKVILPNGKILFQNICQQPVFQCRIKVFFAHFSPIISKSVSTFNKMFQLKKIQNLVQTSPLRNVMEQFDKMHLKDAKSLV